MTFTTVFFFFFFSLISLPCLFSLPLQIPKPLPNDVVFSATRLLDSHLQDLAFKAFFRPRTGVPYDAKVPSNLTGVTVSAMRLKSGSLFFRGVQNFREFEIPSGVIERPYVERIVLVYLNLGYWSEKFYPLPPNYSYLAPVLGLLAYSAANLSASGLPELQLIASKKPILIKFPHVKSPPSGSIAKCVHFDSNGLVKFYTLLQGTNYSNNVCSSFQQGHFSIVVESNGTESSSSSSSHAFSSNEKTQKSNKYLIPCFVVVVLLCIYWFLPWCVTVCRTKQGSRIQQSRESVSADSSGNLQMASISGTRAPFAIGTRTRPAIEDDYFP